MRHNGSPLKPVRDSKTESLVNVQKIIKETNDQIATKPALVLAAVIGIPHFSRYSSLASKCSMFTFDLSRLINLILSLSN